MSLRAGLPQILFALMSGCATPQYSELRAGTPNEDFLVSAMLTCLYEKSVEHVSSYIGINEPKFSWFRAADGEYAWFRQPLTLIELKSKSIATEVVRYQTLSAEALGQGNELIKFLKSNPCRDDS